MYHFAQLHIDCKPLISFPERFFSAGRGGSILVIMETYTLYSFYMQKIHAFIASGKGNVGIIIYISNHYFYKEDRWRNLSGSYTFE